MRIKFYKYQGTGNDFVMIDNRDHAFDWLDETVVQQLCNRKFGIGADGLIRINSHSQYAFEMDYFNADGTKSFCGNGARCSVAFAKFLNAFEADNVEFLAIDGLHQASIQVGEICLKMNDVNQIERIDELNFTLNTGSPHYITFTTDAEKVDIVEYGRSIRYNETYKAEGINVNLVSQLNENTIQVATYERGVEDETLSCGTGVTAAAIAFAVKKGRAGIQEINVETKGGKLAVTFDLNKHVTNIFLKGPAVNVFSGEFLFEKVK